MATDSSADKSSSAMAQLLAKHQNQFVTLRKGESVKGKITKLTRSEILIDTGAKTEAIVLEKDKGILRTILELFTLGDTVEVNVLNPESETGVPIVSLRRYLGKLAWEKLEELQKNKKQLEVTITEAGKSGFVVLTAFGISGFLPQSHTSFSTQQSLQPGTRVNVSVLELNRKDNKVIFSQKPALTDDEFEALVKKFSTGKKITVTIMNITPAGLVVSLDPLEGFIHISEVSWENVDDLSRLFQNGQQIEAVITKIDKDSRRIQLSIKRLTEDPFEELMAQFPVDKKVTGTVKEVMDSGISISLAGQAEGFIRKEKIPLTTTYKTGQQVTATVSEYDKKRRRIILVPVLLEKPLGYR